MPSFTIASLLCTVLASQPGSDSVTVSPAVADTNGFLVHEVESPYQSGKTQIRVLLPDNLKEVQRYPVIYVLPVEAKNESRYGDGLVEIKKLDVHDKLQAIFVAPTFAQLPWYADNPTDPKVRQESYFVEVVVPAVEKHYPAIGEAKGRLLLGFSKSGWGTWSLLLRHPNTFGRAAAWDAPLMMDRFGKYGNTDIFATQANFEKYRLTDLFRANAAKLQGEPRLVLTGYGNFHAEHLQAHALLDELKIPHSYRDGPQRKHDWHSGWVEEAVELLMAKEAK
jgi:enterochelin esterase-like enzyme